MKMIDYHLTSKKITALLESFKHKKEAALLEPQSLVGLLNFACSVSSTGRPFLRCLIDLAIGIIEGDLISKQGLNYMHGQFLYLIRALH